MDKKPIKVLLNEREDLQKFLFDKGFLITNDETIDLNIFPFYGNWKTKRVGSFYVYLHSRAKFYSYENDGRIFFLIGHAYNPFTMETQEIEILKNISRSYNTKAYFNTLDELTGVFFYGVISESDIEFTLDASGMQYGCYGKVGDKYYITSHMRLIGDIYSLETSNYVKRLTSYKWYHYMMGNYLPGELTCYEELKRIIPNTYIFFKNGQYQIERFYPSKQIEMCKNKEEYNQVIQRASLILQNTMSLIPKKWERVAISLTGGIDSNTTFAAANGNYDKYSSFSYVSLGRESVDSQKAKEISDKFNVHHSEYIIPNKNEDIDDFDLFKTIFEHNDGDIGYDKDNEVRKKAILIQSDVCDVEVKSWISETIRAYAYKYFGKKKFPRKMKARHYTSLYKIFLLKRKLVRETDKYFAKYLSNTRLKEHLFNYDETDFFVWEMMHGGKCGLNIGVMKSCFDITIPYNNRKLLDLLLRVPLRYRISDQHHLDLKKIMNRQLYDMNIRVVNGNETKLRKKMIGIYFSINSWLPF